jgi:quercetin dioxygenase-like cupin family protein
MNINTLTEAVISLPKPAWTRLSLARAKNFSIGYFYRSAGHSTPAHHHTSEQVSIVIEGHMKVIGADGIEYILGPGDSAYFGPDEMHQIEHAGTGQAVGIDIFSPARSCDLWVNQ